MAILGIAGFARAAEERSLAISSVDKVTIRSDEAWEDAEPDIIHFSGSFLLEARDWNVYADQATLYGNLDDPETVILSGTPARIRVTARSRGKSEDVEGDAPKITYLRELNIIRLEGGASLARAGNVLRGGEIEYNLENDRFRAGGKEGVRIIIPQDE